MKTSITAGWELAILLLLSLSCSAPVWAKDRVFQPLKQAVGDLRARTALVIGNASYKANPLDNPLNDAEDMANALRETGFEVHLLQDADRVSMLKAVRRFGDQLKERRGVGLFYYAGHGMQVKGRNYLIPVNADIRKEDEVEYFAVDANSILSKMETAGNNFNMMILDACRDNPFKRSFRTGSQGLARMDAPDGTLIAYATAPGSTASDGQGRNGVFTHHLLRQIKQPNLEIGFLLRKVRQEVKQATNEQQIPWEGSSITGEFYFLRNWGSTIQPTTIPPPPSTTLPPQLGHLQVLVNVSKAKVYLNGDYIGDSSQSSALNKSSLASGQYTVTVQAEGCPKQSKPVSLGNNQWSTLSFQLKCDEGKDYSQDRITGMPFVKVSGGSFKMGDLFAEGGSNEKTIRSVRVSDFWLGKHEVTQGEWLKVMGGSNPSYFQKGDDHPVEQVSWEMAQDFIRKLNQLNGLSCSGSFPYKSGCYRLPTEAEWEYACREGGRKVRFGNGSDTADPSQINFDASSAYKKDYSRVGTYRQSTVSVKDLKPNSLGLYHMSGNVREWVQDKYESDYSKIGTDNPIYTGSGGSRVSRGGSWGDAPGGVRCAHRDDYSPARRSHGLGFRLARTD